MERNDKLKLGVLGGVALLLVVALVLFRNKNEDASTSNEGGVDAPVASSSASASASTVIAPPPPSIDASEPALPPGMTVLYTSAPSSGSFSIEGIDVDRRHAWIRREAPGVFEILSVDYEKSPPVIDTWAASAMGLPFWSNHALDFHPLNGTLESDVARYGEIARATRKASAPIFAASADRVVYAATTPEKEGATWLFGATKDGKDPKRIDTGFVSSDAPVFSQDGRRVVFRGCAKEPCGNSVYVASIGGTPTKMGISGDVLAPVVFGSNLYVFARGSKDAGGCLWRAEVEHPDKPTKVHCLADALASGDAVLDDRFENALVCGKKTDAYECAWVSLADGSFRGSLRAAAMPFIVSRAGIALAKKGDDVVRMHAEDIVVYDLASGQEHALASPHVEVARFVSDSEIVGLHTDATSFRIARIDVRKWF